jgi:hypothetical protein
MPNYTRLREEKRVTRPKYCVRVNSRYIFRFVKRIEMGGFEFLLRTFTR